MDSESLRTASEYLNNLLLARGFLRDAEPIDFVRPSKQSRAQIINLVHDLVLRNDRDKEVREQTAFSYRQLRAEEDQKTQEIKRLQLKHEEAERATVQAQTAERVAKDSLRKLERSIKTLQEQGIKLKSSLAQVKAQCTNDVRKRDVELSRLKAHLQGQQRGNRTATIAPSISLTGDKPRPTFATDVRDVADPQYSLRQETNEFLTQLSSSLSEENDRLINLVRNAVVSLRTQLGLQTAFKGASDSGIGDDSHDDKLIQSLPVSVDTLSSELELMMTHLKALLTNPSFVSIEEVEVREEEIAKLRADWEKMEQRWRDLLSMMHGWQKRMDTGGNINIEDLQRGMGLVSPGHVEPISFDNTRAEECSLLDDSIADSRSGPSNAQSRALETDHHKINGQVTRVSRIPKPQQQVLEAGERSPKRKRDPLDPPESFDLRPRPVQAPIHEFIDNVDDNESEELDIPRMTIEEKLSAVAEEAAAARVSMSDDSARSRALFASLDGAIDGEATPHGDLLGKLSQSKKRTKIGGKPKRRKSTLSRDELAELLIDIGG